ncbi:uncharacterized protein METZ01_LOCUS452571, partial [marine metagenome]
MPEIGEQLKSELLGDYIISGEVLHDVKVLPWSPHKYALPEKVKARIDGGLHCPREGCFRLYGFREPLAI